VRHATDFFRFGPVRQEVGSKHVRKGDLIEAINVRQTNKAGVYAKREGFERTAQTFSGGSLSGAPVEALPGTGQDTLMRDAGDQLWSRSNTTNEWTYKGKNVRPWPEVSTIQSNLYTVPQPFSCLVGSLVWVFALTTNAYEFTIIDGATGSPTSSKVTVSATGIVHASAAYDGTNVWVFWVDNGANGTIRCHKFAVSTPAVAPTATNFYTFPSSPTDVSTVALQKVQARFFSTTSRVMVVACGGSKVTTTYKRACAHAVLDPSNGLASAAAGEAATVSYAYSGTTAPYTISGLYILDGQTGANANWFYTYVNWPTATSAKLYVAEVTNGNTASFTTNSTDLIGSFSSPEVYACSGYYDHANLRTYILVSMQSATTNVTDFWQINNRVFSWGGAYGAAANDIRKKWVASGFAKVGSDWYVITGSDDWSQYRTQMGAENLSLQRCFHVRKFVPSTAANLGTWDIISQFQMGSGPAVFHKASAALTFAAGTPPITCVPPVHVIGNTIVSAIAVGSVITGYVDLAVSRIVTDKEYGKCAQAMGYAFCPGSIPVAWNSGVTPHEVAPLDFPSYITIAGGTGTDFSIAAVCYAIYDGNGVVWRSAPKVVSASIGHGATLSVPEPTVTGNVPLFVEFYIGNNSTPKLQTAVSYVVGSGVANFTTPTVAAMIIGESLYTTGNALSNTWPVPCQSMEVWNNRLFFARGNRIFVSKELEPGFGPIFNEVQSSTWSEEQNSITAMAPVDWNYLAILSEGQVATISGPGPDGVGNGNYVIKTLSFKSGIVEGGIALQGAGGCYFQTRYNGRIMCITPSLQVVEAAGGAYDYSAYDFTTGAWYEDERLMVFFAPASRAAIAIDYQHVGDATPFGQVYLWTFAAGLTTSAVTVDHDGIVVVGNLGGIYRSTRSVFVDGNSSGTTDTYDMDLATAELQFGDLQGEITVAKVQALLSMYSASGVYIDVFPSYASPTQADSRVTSVLRDLSAPTNSGDTRMVMTRPPNCSRVPSIRVRIREKAGVTGRSFEFEGLAIDYTTSGRLWHPPSGDVI
jgi:hypothetical protein